ncbi:MAG TPA: ferritin-like domain-containing protein [Stellaceae bacterium]|nr:ferritin-like domain-containing protein [Stellaceae bacterium]
MTNEATLAAADHTARYWAGTPGGAFRPGSDGHKTAFCRMLLDTHNPYKPAVIEWPVLPPDARDRLVSLPIWDIAVQTEGKARARVLGYAGMVRDPLLRQAVELDGFEEGRHKQVLSNMVAAYGIRLQPEPPYPPPRHPEWAFMTTGFSECIDSFFAFGLFEVARRSGYFPPELVDTFEPVMQEEARHILFFVNWVAWHQRTMPWWRRPWFWAMIAAVWICLIKERIGLSRGIGAAKDEAPQDNNFTLTGSKAVADVDISVRELLDLCLAENDRRMQGYDRRLLRPKAVPRLVRFARRFMRAAKPATGVGAP